MGEHARGSTMTADELFLVPCDDAQCELVEGIVVRAPRAGAVHGKLVARIARVLDEFVESRGLGVVCGADTGFVLRRAPDTVRAPDVSFVAKERVPPSGEPEKYWPMAPDLAVEIVSPWDGAQTLQEKIGDYLSAGTRVVWIVYPRTRVLLQHRSLNDVRAFAEEDALVADDVLPEFACPVRRIFD
jgi:Uma2 family endonuclease